VNGQRRCRHAGLRCALALLICVATCRGRGHCSLAPHQRREQPARREHGKLPPRDGAEMPATDPPHPRSPATRGGSGRISACVGTTRIAASEKAVALGCGRPPLRSTGAAVKGVRGRERCQRATFALGGLGGAAAVGDGTKATLAARYHRCPSVDCWPLEVQPAVGWDGWAFCAGAVRSMTRRGRSVPA
jgi:hypothetical protein